MWAECIVDNDYEIYSEFPFPIRRKGSDKIISESVNGSGYIQIHLNSKTVYKHRVIAEQFIPNPDNLPFIDHINRNRVDYRIENLHWVSASENNKNKTSHLGVTYDYVDTIPNDSIVVDYYGKYEYEDLYFYDDVFYFYNGIKFRILRINENKRGALYVNTYDTTGKQRKIFYSKFKREHDLI